MTYGMMPKSQRRFMSAMAARFVRCLIVFKFFGWKFSLKSTKLSPLICVSVGAAYLHML